MGILNIRQFYEPEAEDLPVPARYYPDSLVELTRTARFTEDEIKRIYRGFKAECPTGIVKEDTFKGIYSQFFPLGGKDSMLPGPSVDASVA
uniref:Uncharacterized protein n=1 Tax=Anopheles albimanus TaxID=7167 RepID=A0A182F2Q7_ANOAL